MQTYRTRLLVVCLFILSLAAFAQTDRSVLTGRITDPAGAVVANAPIEVRNQDTGALFTSGTSATGNYTLSVPRGTYELTVTVTGFKTHRQQNILIPVATTVRQDIELEVGATTESITVSDVTPLLKTESSDLSHNIEYQRANQLPVLTLGGAAGLGNVRNPLQVVTLMPGARFDNENILRINGMPSNSQSVRIEGQDATNGLWRQINQTSQAGLEAIEEVAVQTSNYAAEYGQAGGGYFNYTMKSGTNQYHGSAYDYIVTESLHAGTPFTSDGRGHHLRNKQRRQDFGGTIGGPIVIPGLYNGHDRSFFFFNFEQFRETQRITTGLANTPTEAYRRGDFSAARGQQLTALGAPATDPLGRPLFQYAIYDPTTQSVAPNGQTIRDPFPNNMIPSTRLDPVAVKIQALFPTPTNGFAINNYVIPPYSNYRHTTIPSFKLDHSLSSTIKISGYFGSTKQSGPGANGFTQKFSAATPQNQHSTTTRINYDQTITPTLLLHLGVGLLYTNQTVIPTVNDFDPAAEIGLAGYYSKLFPAISGVNNFQQGGAAFGGTGFFAGSGIGVGRFGGYVLKDIKPTANASLTWVKGNHTYKFGGEAVFEGFPQKNFGLTNGSYTFSSLQTAIPSQNGQALNSTTGFEYASFLLGPSNNLQVSPINDTRLGNHTFGFFAQDTWKLTPKLTLDYGLRYDYAIVMKEQYGRMQSGSFDTLNPTVGRLGAVIYEGNGPGRCGCTFSDSYKLSFGPRVGAAYQINNKTVFRAGFGINYGTSPNNAFLSLSVADFFTALPAGYAQSAANLRDGNPYRAGNPFGNPTLVFPNFDVGKYPFPTADGLTPQSPFINIDRHAGRLPRIAQWSVSLQREVMRDLVVEAAYVGNRGVWWSAPTLADMNYNTVTPEFLQSRYGINIRNADDRSLLLTPISSPVAAQRGFNTPAYKGFPMGQPVIQTLVPFPQWGNGQGPSGVPPFLGPPLGVTWYDSLQVKATKRYSFGLDFQAAYTFQKELSLGANSDTSYFTAGTNRINDVYNRNQNKQWSALSQPHQFVFSYNYTVPAIRADGGAMKVVSQVLRDWTFGGVLRYQSGALLAIPTSNNQLTLQLGRGFTNNPAVWGGAATYFNIVPGQKFFAQGFDVNGSFDPTKQLVLNPAAWVDAAPGEFSVSAPYYNNFRWRRQPSEAMNFGRIFRFGPESAYQLQVRMEFQNVFNRTFYGAPSTANPNLPASQAGGVFTSGYGFVSTFNGLGSSPRQGQIVARFTF